jgi:hypothetical protein
MSSQGSVQTENEAQRTSKIPHFRSIEEEAEFWDTHDSTEFEDEFEDVEDDTRFIVLRPTERWIPLVLDSDAMAVLEERASQEQIGTSALIRKWVLEKLQAS